jgi:hypothetical protein
MARFYRFIDSRLPELMREWEEIQAMQASPRA